MWCWTSWWYVYWYTDNLINCWSVDVSCWQWANTTYNWVYCVFSSLTNTNCIDNTFFVCTVTNWWIADRDWILMTAWSYDSCWSTTTITYWECQYSVATNSSTGSNRWYAPIRKWAKITTTWTVTLTFYSF